jgi:hypothetical protein
VTTAIVGVISFFFGAACGLILGGIAAAAARAEEHAAARRLDAEKALRSGALFGSSLVRDFHVVDTDEGSHIVPPEASPPSAAQDSPPPAG